MKGLDGGTHVQYSSELVTAVLDLGTKQTIMLQLALSKELGLMLCTVLNMLGDCINHPSHWLGTWPFLLDKATGQILHLLLKEHPFDDL